jgi:diguanylate cyclase (GGDEF)-like protein
MQVRGISTRLALLAAGAVLLVIALGGGAMVRGMAETYRAETRLRAASLLGTLAVPCATSLSVHALDRLDGYLADVTRAGGEHMGVLQADMLDSQGRIIARANAPGLGEQGDLLDDDFVRRAATANDALWRETADLRGQPILLVSMPAVSGVRWGTLVAAFDMAPVDRRIAWATRSLALLALSLAVVLALVLYVGLTKLVIRPVQALSRAAESIQSGQLGARSQLTRDDELGRLSAIFDGMAAQIESSTRDLEAKVAARSADLAAVNARLQEAVRELDRLARIDALTQVPNRRQFEEVLTRELERRRTTSLIMVDVDHFKQFNDTWGHHVGDVVLREVAQQLGQGLRGEDVLARYGGEEFVVVLPATPAEAAREVAERLRAKIAHHDFAPATGQPVGTVTISLGLASLPDDATTAAELKERADQALYAAKQAGRNRVVRWRT